MGHAAQSRSAAVAEAPVHDSVPILGRATNQRTWWLIVSPEDGADICSVDPGFDVDLYVVSDLRSLTAIWMGLDNVRAAVRDERVVLTGDRKLAADMQTWLGLSPFAKEKKLVA